MATVIVGAIVFAAVILAVRSMVKDHASGKGSCSCGSCGECPGSQYCHGGK